MNSYSTAQVARMLSVDKSTLLRWLYVGKISEPKHLKDGGQDIRVWSDRDVEKARKYKELNFRKGRGRKKT